MSKFLTIDRKPQLPMPKETNRQNKHTPAVVQHDNTDEHHKVLSAMAQPGLHPASLMSPWNGRKQSNKHMSDNA